MNARKEGSVSYVRKQKGKGFTGQTFIAARLFLPHEIVMSEHLTWIAKVREEKRGTDLEQKLFQREVRAGGVALDVTAIVIRERRKGK